MSDPLNRFYEFDQFRIDPEERVLLCNGTPVTLAPKVFDTLLALVERHGHIVEKDDLLQRLWPDTFVEENNLSQCISAIRKTLGDGRHEQRYVETVPRRGYRFTGAVREISSETELIQVSHTKVNLRIHEETETSEAIVPVPVMQRAGMRRAVLAAALVVLVFSAVFVTATMLRRGDSIAPSPLPIKTLAVLPLASGAGDDQFLGLSVADQLIAGFNQSLDINIRPTNSVHRYMAIQRDAATAGRELKTDAVFDGEAQKIGDRIVVTIRLISTSDGKVLWQAKQADELRNTSKLTTSLVDKAAREVFAVSASSLKSVLAKPGTTSPAAHEAYVKGRYYWNNRTAQGLHKSIGLFEQAITLDPNFALAHAGLADAYAFDRISWSKAEAAARKALELDGALGQAHATIGFVRWFWLWDWDEAAREYKLAIALSPDYATAHQWYGLFLASRHYPREAKAELQQALQLDPFSLPINADLAQVLYFMGDFDGAIQQCKQTLALDQNFVNAHLYLYQAYTMKGLYEEAVAEYFKLQEIIVRDPGFGQQEEKALRAAYAKNGIRGFWREKLRTEEPVADKIRDPYQRAQYFALLGEKEQALEALSVAINRRDQPALFTKVDPMLRSLFEDSRFDALLQQVDNVLQKDRVNRRTHTAGS
ncbi:MAG TPA: winged helix-turn-helix domain-containing protein [Pyrinomonadaceae bacterium]|nr:winged helix-turn-helix domain-containing protein [Pyrinomonadaceae bacterium]